MVQFDVKRVQKGTESFMVSFDFTRTPITQIADYIIIAASKHGTSDIHFDPREAGMMVRFRIDGDCQDYTFIPKAYERNLTTRLKLLANMNITESRLPQDGAIKGNFGDTYLDMRVSCLPVNEGEKIVIRILDYTRSLQGIDSLGFHPDNLSKVKRMMGIPNGIILTTGATGSGKSTTTYSILQGLNKPETNVITVEDPIEMNIEGINQVQVNADIGMTFAAALRSILRQDPNVILIGEIRDSETAQIAVRASITGHLVLSTIHTNNSLATIERLLDMDVERYLLSTALTGIISQRLAKQICPTCRYQRATTNYEKKIFKKYIKKDIPTVWDANPNGCDDCRKGYKGRIAFHEVLELDDEIRMALNNENLEKKELAKMVYSSKTITMLQDALMKCLEGKTSFEEVYRAIEIENEDDDDYQNEINQAVKEAAPIAINQKESDDLLDDDMGQGQGNISNVNISQPQPEETNESEKNKQPNNEEQKTENDIEPVTPPQVQPISTPLVEPVATPQVQPISTPLVEPVTTPQVQPISTPLIEPVATPQVQSISTPLVEPVVTPQVQSISTPLVEPVATPQVQSISTPLVEPVVAPQVQPISAPLVEPVMTPQIELQPLQPPVVQPITNVQPEPINIQNIQPAIMPTQPIQSQLPTVPGLTPEQQIQQATQASQATQVNTTQNLVFPTQI